MKKFWVHFDGYCVVEGENEEQAEWSFFEHIYPPVDEPVYNEVYTITKIEEVEEQK
jgi:hypothetical protein